VTVRVARASSGPPCRDGAAHSQRADRSELRRAGSAGASPAAVRPDQLEDAGARCEQEHRGLHTDEPAAVPQRARRGNGPHRIAGLAAPRSRANASA